MLKPCWVLLACLYPWSFPPSAPCVCEFNLCMCATLLSFMIACGRRQQRLLNMAKKMLAPHTHTRDPIQGYYVNELAPCVVAVISLNRQPKSKSRSTKGKQGGTRQEAAGDYKIVSAANEWIAITSWLRELATLKAEGGRREAEGSALN